MRYDYEFKKMCVDLYRQGKWPETPEGYNDPGNFHAMIVDGLVPKRQMAPRS